MCSIMSVNNAGCNDVVFMVMKEKLWWEAMKHGCFL